ncbi:hypothetical protein PLIIFM63780_010193 [Purpureocillium lilacinum]|uniref:Uncharacterized protein n=1 Tax=Purpureocillium lilacinum TaxID=33203 RepID=A0A179GE83_PURLI|nr:hypothetical protein VFPBJ_09412 [Purpureocillium lilacinum]GJN86612.1 hypothetical protein PLIIFM63780_010193 [Purpureocillium lilacinum]
MPFHLPFRSKPTEPAPSVARSWASSPDHHGRHPKDAPKPLARSDTLHSRYVQMLLGQDDIPALHNILASFFVWLLLAGFLVFPGTFTSIQHSLEGKEDSHAWTDQTTEKIFKSVKNIPLLVLAAIACGVSVVGMASLALRHLPNYVWLLNKLIVPGVANCLAGLISTLVGVYSQQHGNWSITAKVTAIVEGSCLGVSIALFFLFDRYLLLKVKESHGQHYETWPSDRSLEEKW